MTDVSTRARVQLRQATSDDLPQLAAMVERFRTSSLYERYVRQNNDQVDRTLAWMLSVPNAAIFVAERPSTEGHLIGMLGLVAYVHPISGDLSASELFWWLSPDDRGWGGWLLRRAEKWAKTQGCASLHMIHPADSPHVGVMYGRLGYEPLEMSYTKRLL